MDGDIRRVDGPAPAPRAPRSRPRRRGEDEDGSFDDELQRHASDHSESRADAPPAPEKNDERVIAPPPEDESGSNLDLIG